MRKPNEPIACHKFIIKQVALSGDEDCDAFDEWFIDMTDEFEILMPGSKAILYAAKESRDRITIQGILARGDAAIAAIDSRELCSALEKKQLVELEPSMLDSCLRM